MLSAEDEIDPERDSNSTNLQEVKSSKCSRGVEKKCNRQIWFQFRPSTVAAQTTQEYQNRILCKRITRCMSATYCETWGKLAAPDESC